MPLCRHRHRLTTIHGVLGSKNAIHRMNTSRNFLIKIPKKRIIKKINNYSVFLSASVVPIIIKNFFDYAPFVIFIRKFREVFIRRIVFFTCQICVLLVNLYNHCPKGTIIVSCTQIKFTL